MKDTEAMKHTAYMEDSTRQLSEILPEITALRHQLHGIPEVSGHETKTKAALQAFLREHTTLELQPCGGGFYAAHREPDATLPAIALRADYDALAQPDGTAAHLCGHDGHSAALCGAALLLEGRTLGRNVFLLFQPAEETGEGAKGCLELFRREHIDEIYGAHNLPGRPLGQVLTRKGTFACGSLGLTLHFCGKPAHAAYPEFGISPAPAVGSLLQQLKTLTAAEQAEGLVLCTVIGVSMGEKAFGAAAERAEVWLTLRAEKSAELSALLERVLNAARTLAEAHRLTLSHEIQDEFPATENHDAQTETVFARLQAEPLAVPMRWSEDFGRYLTVCPGAFFGIGAGEAHPELHTEHYEYPDALLEPAVTAWCRLLQLEA